MRRTVATAARNMAASARYRQATRAAIRESDVFLVGHPKSGNTLVAYALALMGGSGDMDQINLANVGTWVPTIHGRDWEVAAHAGLDSPRCFRNEWPLFPDLYPKVVYLVRDPRAVLVSYYHHYRRVSASADLDLSSFIGIYLRHGCIPSFEPRLERWDVQVSKWLDRARRPTVSILRYEDVVADRRGQFSRLAREVGFDADADQMDAVFERTSFEAMRELESRFGAESFLGSTQLQGDPSERFVRQGLASGWQSELSPDDAARIVRLFGAVMSRVGYR